jgi:hypothetical protein
MLPLGQLLSTGVSQWRSKKGPRPRSQLSLHDSLLTGRRFIAEVPVFTVHQYSMPRQIVDSLHTDDCMPIKTILNILPYYMHPASPWSLDL